MQRQGATCNGLKRRVFDLGLNRVEDPRIAGKVSYPLPTVLTALVAAMTTMVRSLRMVEQRTGQMAQTQGQWMGVGARIADNTFGKVLPRLSHGELMECLHCLVKAEHRRGNLAPTCLPRGTVAIDGKNVATLHWHDMLRVLKLKPDETTVCGATTCRRTAGWTGPTPGSWCASSAPLSATAPARSRWAIATTQRAARRMR